MRIFLLVVGFCGSVHASLQTASGTDFTESELEFMAHWLREETKLQAKVAVLEYLLENPKAKDAALLAFVDSRVTGHSETLMTIANIRMNALFNAFQPLWFHNALSAWNLGPLVPVSEQLVNYLESIRPPSSPPQLRTREALVESVILWNSLCIDPLRATQPSEPVPCYLRTISMRGAEQPWVILASHQTRKLIAQRLDTARINAAN